MVQSNISLVLHVQPCKHIGERNSESLTDFYFTAMSMLLINTTSITPYATCQKNHLEFDGKAVAAL